MLTAFSNKKSNYIPDFDSSSSMLFSLGNYLANNSEPVGILPKFPMEVGQALNRIPKSLLMLLFTIGGAKESLSFKKLAGLNDQIISSWITGAYPEKKYPAVMIGSSNGALIHLCAMLGIPWIPQTILLALSRKMDADELIADIEWGKKAVSVMKDKLSYFRLHQMHDPVQDRRMVTNMGYFRVKRLKLGPYLEDFLRKALMPNATIFIADCQYRWPSHKISDQHYFQVGGLGDVDGYEYLNGSSRIAKFLEKQGSSLRNWKVPSKNQEVPEAEWGFADELTGNINSFAKSHGYRLVRAGFNHPEDASPFSADLVEWWYERNGIKDNRLLIECFALLVPWWTARTGSIPFWIAFNTSNSLLAFKNYIKNKSKFKEIYALIMPNAVEGVGLVPLKEWKKLIRKNSFKSALIGTDESIYPYDLGIFIKYFKDLQIKINARHFIPHSLDLREFFEYVKKHEGRYRISFKNIK